MWVKFCGITRLEDALYAKELGADAIGFVFAKSPRQVPIEQARHISSGMDGIIKVGVFVDEGVEQIEYIRSRCGLDLVQLHGEETPELCTHFGQSCIKAFRIKKKSDLAALSLFPGTWKNLIDAFVPGQPGGTGKTIDDEILNQVKNPGRIILAGGLHPENISDVLEGFAPFGIDVSSGVEKGPGIKDHSKMKRFIEIIKYE